MGKNFRSASFKELFTITRLFMSGKISEKKMKITKELIREMVQEELENAIEEIKKNTRRYAKRQMTWFRKDPSNHFFKPENESEIMAYLKENITN